MNRCWCSGALAFVFVLALPWATRHAEAQPSRAFASLIPSGADVRMIAERRFEGSSGLRSSTVYAMDVDAGGHPWLAADDGLYAYAGGSWRREPLPTPFDNQQIRSLLLGVDHTRWIGTRRGLLRSRRGVNVQHFTEADGLPGSVIYSLAETPAIDGTMRVVVGASNGVAFFNGTRFVRMPLPPEIAPLGMMVTASRGADRVPELWVASSRGGVARYRQGIWTAFTANDGLRSPDAQFLLDAPGERAARLYVAGAGGVFVLDSAERRFLRIAGSPSRAHRLAAVPALAGGFSLWVGPTEGRLHEWRGGRWYTISTTLSERRGPVTMMRAIPRHAGGAAVYVSARGGHLSRLSVGVAGTVDLESNGYDEQISSVLALPGAGGRDEIWMGSSRSGLMHLTADGRVERISRPGGASFGVVQELMFVSLDPAQPPGVTPNESAARVVFVADGELFARRDGSFTSLAAGLSDRVVFRADRLTMPDGRNVLVAGTDRGLFEWNGARWSPSAVAMTGMVTGLAAATLNGEPVLYAGGSHVVRRVSAQGTVIEPIPDVGTRALGTGVVKSICRVSVGSSAHLFALDTERGVFWRPEAGAGPWALLPARLMSMSTSSAPTSMHCAANGQLLISTLHGLAALDVTKADTAQWRVSAHVSEADGLPSGELMSASVGGSTDVAWVGTSAGLGVVNLSAARGQVPPRLELRLTAEATGRDVSDEPALDREENDVHVEPMLFSYHREEDTRYRVRLHRRRSAFGRTETIGSIDARLKTEWLDASNRYYLDLEAGDYELEAWAYDWAGREYGPVRRTFSVRGPAWSTWYAWALYVALVVLLVIVAFRWRVNVIRSNGLQLLESERRLRDSERKFRTIFDRAMDAQLLVEDGRVITGNAMAATLFTRASP